MLLIGSGTTWKACAPLALPRSGYAAGILSHRFIVAGGSYWTTQGKERTSLVGAFDPQCNCWLALPSMPVAISDAASVVVENQLFVIGGADRYGGSREVYAFDGDRWVHRSDMRLPEARMNGAAVTDGHRIYLMGGMSLEGNYSSGIRSFWSIDPADASRGWERLPDCPGPSRVAFAATWIGRRIIILGGYRAEGSEHENLTDIWSYDVRDKTWRMLGRLPEGRRAMWAFAVDHTIYLLGGYTDDFSSDILVWRDGKVIERKKLPEAVADAKFFRIGCNWYTTGGEVAIHIRGGHTWAGKISSSCEEKNDD